MKLKNLPDPKESGCGYNSAYADAAYYGSGSERMRHKEKCRRILRGTLASLLTAALILSCSSCAAAPGRNTPEASGISGGAGLSAPVHGASDDGLKIVTTVFAPYDFIRQISAGTDTDVSMLLSPGTEVHSYDPTVQDIIDISECDLFVYTGGENDEWVNDILDSLETPVRTFRMIEHAVTVEEEIKEGMQTSGHAHADEDTHEEHSESHTHDDGDVSGHEAEWDEHVWTSPRNAEMIVSGLTDELCTLDSENSSVYRKNCESYTRLLEELDSSFREVISDAPHKIMIFADRFPIRYFTEEYGIDYFAAYPGCAADAEPSAATVRFLIDRVRSENIKAVFYIEMSNQRLADTVCEATGAEKLLFHSCHNVTKDEFESGATYMSIMQNNLVNLKTALY